jgi:hypothetical protein
MANVPVVCRLFGTQVLMHIAPHCVHRGKGPIGLEIVPGGNAAPGVERRGLPVLSMPMVHPEGAGQYEVWVTDAALVLHLPPVAEFSLTPERIEYRCLNDVREEALQWQLFGLVMSTWSEWAGRPVLHAATVEVGDSAVAFLGRCGAGKSSLTLEFLRSGHRVFGDDQLILERTSGTVFARPAIPWLKVGPDLAVKLGLDPELLPRIHSGAEKRRLDIGDDEWMEDAAPLGPLYLVERGWHRPEVLIEPVGPAESLIALIQQTFAPRTVAASGLAERRVPLLAAAVQQAGVWRLRYPNGAEWLPRVRAAVARHQSERVSESPAPFRR